MIVGMAGPAGSGKDTVADYLVERFGFIKLSWAGPLKQGLAAMGMPEPVERVMKERPVPGFDFTWREAAQKLGTEWGRGLDPDIWVKLVGRRLREAPRHQRFVISDCRFENEATMVRSLGGVMLHLRGRAADLGANAGHASEQGIAMRDGDWRIDNSGDLDMTLGTVRHALRLGDVA